MKQALSVLSLALATTALLQPAAFASPNTQSAEVQPKYSQHEVRRMARDARTPQQYTVLADYYAARKRSYAHKAAEAMHLYALRNSMINPVSEKWPRPVDSARNLHDYYAWEAAHSEAMRAKFDRLASDAEAR